MASPLEVFRKPHAVRVFGKNTLVKGVITPGPALESSLTCSVQRIGSTQQEQITARGKRVSDFRRIYTDKRLPITEEAVTGSSVRVPEPFDLVMADGSVIDVVDGEGPAGQVMIDGIWYEVDQRHPMQNGVINHFQYLLVRVMRNDQSL